MEALLWLAVGLVACMMAAATATIATLQPKPKGCECDGIGTCRRPKA